MISNAPSSLLVAGLALLGGAQGAAVERRADKSSGCGQHHNFVGSTGTFGIESSGGYREYRIHLPSTYDKDSAMPLLIAYHGAGNNPTNFEKQTRFSDEGVNPNMVTVYPAGVNGNWQGPSYATDGVSDKVFTTDLVNHITDHYCIDKSRVYATGHSNGAGFVGTLACSPGHGGQFAAFAPVSGAFYSDVYGNDACHPARSPMPMMEAHGVADPTISYWGKSGRGGNLPSIQDWIARWAIRNDCTSSEVKDIGNGVHHYKWKCNGIDDLVQHYMVDGHDHSWFDPGNEIDISPVVIDFLSKQYKP